MPDSLLRSGADACAVVPLIREYGEREVRWMLAVIASDVEAAAGRERQIALCL